MNRTIAIIPVTGPVVSRNVEEPVLRTLQGVVGGWIEGVSLPDDHSYAPGHFLYLNEEGKLKGLARNERASVLVQGVIRGDDFVVGDCVVMGPANPDGDSTSVSPVVLAVLQAMPERG